MALETRFKIQTSYALDYRGSLSLRTTPILSESGTQVILTKPPRLPYDDPRKNVVFLERDFPADTQRDELLLDESSEVPQSNAGTSSAPTISPNHVPIIRRSAGVPQPPAIYGFLGAMDVKMAFLNDFIKEEIYMDQPKRFTNISFDEVIRGYDFIKNDFDPYVYKNASGSSIGFLVLYVGDILLIGNDVKMLGDTKAWFFTQFSVKDLGDASYILEIKIFRDDLRGY
ncbi:UNVERIFIED_CONTAM: hypothetical protein Scaly_2935500 [Sesamum calycinum]|uniref:Reverse transcriptase Ty1/copia-type domain-containing protein n=1 Tax=Sesamum calycinum TaxID=2727403 RepID=A0AAW2KVT0_9LAMI